MARQEDMSQKVEELNHSAGKIFFLMKTLVLYLFDHLVEAFVHFISTGCIFGLVRIYVADAPKIQNETFS